MPRSTQAVSNTGVVNASNYLTLIVGATTMIVPINDPMVCQGLWCPSNLTATSVTLVEASPDNGVSWYQVWSSGNLATAVAATAFSFYVAAGRLVRLSPADMYGAYLFRFTFNTAQLTSNANFKVSAGVVTGD